MNFPLPATTNHCVQGGALGSCCDQLVVTGLAANWPPEPLRNPNLTPLGYPKADPRAPYAGLEVAPTATKAQVIEKLETELLVAHAEAQQHLERAQRVAHKLKLLRQG